MKIGFISSKSNNDPSQLSGAAFYMEKALKKHCGEVVFLQPTCLASALKFPGRTLNRVSQLITNKGYASQHSLIDAYIAGKHFASMAQRTNVDIIFATRAATQLAYLQTKIPIIYTSDTTFKLMENYYGYWSNLHKISSIEGNHIEQMAIKNSTRIFYPSSWPVESAIHDYGAHEDYVSVIKSGANLDQEDILSMEEIFSRKDLSRCRLLFIGVSWERKGGAIALDTLNYLLASNIPAELTIVGCEPPQELWHDKIKVIKKLDKTIPDQRKVLLDLFKEANFFLLPTRAETAGLVFNEAAAFGLPVITTDTGGVASIVREGLNGYTIPYNDDGRSYATLIQEIYNDPERYKKLAITSRQEYEKTLNWDCWGNDVKQLMSSIFA